MPEQQSLERLVCAALCRAHPGRARSVATWLAPREGGPGGGHKNHAWSYMAGWHAEEGCEHFYRSLWADEALARSLEEVIGAAVRGVMELAAA